jgi:hypothetical protein
MRRRRRDGVLVKVPPGKIVVPHVIIVPGTATTARGKRPLQDRNDVTLCSSGFDPTGIRVFNK